MGYLEAFFAILSVSISFTLLLKKCKIEPTLGYIITGIVLGPQMFGFLNSPDELAFLGELGIILLLFNIGVELSFNRLKTLAKLIFGAGLLQFSLTGIVLCFILYKYFSFILFDAIIIGCGLALSSTALIMQMLSKHSELSSKFGRLSFCILLFQDLAVVPIIIFSKIAYSQVPLIQMIAGVSNNICVALFICILLGKFVLKPLFKIAADEKTYDIFMMMTLSTIIGISIITLKAGLSVEFGAFLAGLMLSETNYRHRVEADIQPFRGILLGMFFITIGMQMYPKIILEFPKLIILSTIGIILLKALIVYIVSMIFGVRKLVGMRVALIVSGCGEFAFVLFGSVKMGIDPTTKNILFSIVSLSMIITPFLDMLGRYIFGRLVHGGANTAVSPLDDRVIIIGYNNVADMLIQLFHDNKIKYLMIEPRIEKVEELEQKGVNIVYGNPTKEMLFDILELQNARVFLINLKNIRESTRAVSEIEKADVTGKIVVRVMNEDHKNLLEEIEFYTSEPSESRYSAVMLGKAVLKEFGYSPNQSEDALKKSSVF